MDAHSLSACSWLASMMSQSGYLERAWGSLVAYAFFKHINEVGQAGILRFLLRADNWLTICRRRGSLWRQVRWRAPHAPELSRVAEMATHALAEEAVAVATHLIAVANCLSFHIVAASSDSVAVAVARARTCG